MKTIGERAQEFRLAKQWNTTRMAKEVGTSRQSIENLEATGHRSPRYIADLARVMGLTVDELMTGQSTPLDYKQNQPLAPVEPAQAATKTIATLAQITEALAGYLMHMDDDGRDDAADILRKLAHKPENHARAATMLTAAFHAPKRKSA